MRTLAWVSRREMGPLENASLNMENFISIGSKAIRSFGGFEKNVLRKD